MSPKVKAANKYGYKSTADIRHFIAGCKAAWTRKWEDNLAGAEAAYKQRHGQQAADIFTVGWCWSASN
jgi:hypothetical protein